MKLSELQLKVLQGLSTSSDGRVLVSVLEDMTKELRDMRNLKEISREEVTGHLLAGDIIESELITRLKRVHKGSSEEEDFS